MSTRPSPPAPEQIRSAREQAGLTQAAAARLVYAGARTWQQWEAGDRRMHPAFWALFRLRAGLDAVPPRPET